MGNLHEKKESVNETEGRELLQALAAGVSALCADVDRWLKYQSELGARIDELEHKLLLIETDLYGKEPGADVE